MNRLSFGASDQQSKFRLLNAILVYGDHNGGEPSPAYATTHPIQHEDGRPVITAGKPLSVQGLRAIQTILDPSTQEILPECVLFAAGGVLAWWIPARQRLAFYRSRDERIGNCNAIIPHPPLVMVASANGHWAIAALRHNRRPAPSTPLYRPPYMNVWLHKDNPGRICTGNVTTPANTMTGKMEAWENAFFDSEFTHPNANGNDFVRFPGGLTGLTVKLVAGCYKRFPTTRLIELGQDLQQFIHNANLNGKRHART
jgi:PRTRC genetic system protein B